MLYLFYLNGANHKFVFISIIICTIILSISYYRVYSNRYNQKLNIRREIIQNNKEQLFKPHRKETSSKKNLDPDFNKEKGLLGEKLDQMLKQAKIDASLFESLGNSIKSFEGTEKSSDPLFDIDFIQTHEQEKENKPLIKVYFTEHSKLPMTGIGNWAIKKDRDKTIFLYYLLTTFLNNTKYRNENIKKYLY